jgi:hypothetical protein
MVYICAKIVNVFCFCKLWDCYRGDSGYRLIVFAERFACLDFLERVAIPGEDSSYRGDSGYRDDSSYRGDSGYRGIATIGMIAAIGEIGEIAAIG